MSCDFIVQCKHEFCGDGNLTEILYVNRRHDYADSIMQNFEHILKLKTYFDTLMNYSKFVENQVQCRSLVVNLLQLLLEFG